MNSCGCSPSRRMRLLAPLSSLAILAVGLILTWAVNQSARQSRARTMLLSHEELTVAAAKHIVSVYTSMIPTVISARQMLVEHDAILNTSQPLHGLLRAITQTLAHTGLTIAAGSAFLESQRHAYETLFTQQCASVLNRTSVPLRSIGDSSWRPVNASPVYAAVVHVGIAGSTDRTEACTYVGLDMTGAVSSAQFIQAVDSGRILWVSPVPSISARSDRINLGVVAPVLASVPEHAGVAGLAHLAFRQSMPDLVFPWTCRQAGPVFEHDAPCGQSVRALGTIAVPVYATTPLYTIVDAVPNAKGSYVTLMFIPPEVRGLVSIDAHEVWSGESPRLYNLTAEPLPDSAYLEESYMQRTSWKVLSGTLKPVLQALQASRVLLSAQYVGSATHHDLVTDAGPAGPMHHGPWKLIPRQDALRKAISAEDDSAALQAARVFMLGPNAYLLIVRDKLGVDTPHWTNAQLLNWVFGSLLSFFVAVLLPLLAAAVSWHKERQYAMQVALMQSEKDGVVQAVAFAAHEIRNPMHGVLASLDTALADLEPLVSLLNRTLMPVRKYTSDDTLVDGPDMVDDTPGHGPLSCPEPTLREELLRILGRARCEAALMAMEDVEVARNSAEGCHRLVNDMVDYSMLQKGMMSIQNGPMNVRAGLRSLVAGHRAAMHPSVRTLLKVHKDIPGSMHTDQVRILQVISNGLTNASKFTTSGEIRLVSVLLNTSDLPALRLQHNPSNQWLCFLVTDTGKGLAGINVDSLFEPIQPTAAVPTTEPVTFRCWPRAPRVTKHAMQPKAAQASPTSSSGSVNPGIFSASSVAKTRGSGLGLPVARLMARVLGGDVDLYSMATVSTASPTADAATVFMFVIPLDALGCEGPIKQHPLFGRTGCLSDAARAELRARACSASEAISPESHCCHVLEELEATGEAHRQALQHHQSRLYVQSIRATAPSRARSGSESELTTASLHVGPARRSSDGDGTASNKIGGLPPVRPPARFSSEDQYLTHDGLAPHVAQALAGTATRRSNNVTTKVMASDDIVLRVVDPAPVAPRWHSRTSRSNSLPEAVTVVSTSAHYSHKLLLTDGSVCHARTAEPSSESLRSIDTGKLPPTSHRPAVIRVLYAEDDLINRRLMDRMLTKLDATTDGVPSSYPRIEFTTVGDGWEALCTLYTHGHVERAVLEKVQQDGFAAQGALVLPPLVPQHRTAGKGVTWEKDKLPPDSKTPAQPFDVILLDIDMPRLNGDEVARCVRASRVAASKASVGTTRVAAGAVGAGARSTAGRVVPLIAVTGRAVEFKLLQSFVDTVHGERVKDSGASVEIVSYLPDPLLNECFDGTLGKPYRLQHLQTLVDLVGACNPGVSSHSQH